MIGKEALDSSPILNKMLSIGISISIGGLECSNDVCCCNEMVEAVEVLVVKICCRCDVPEFRNNEGKDGRKESEKFPSFQLAMAWFTQIDWWSLYPGWESDIPNAIPYCLQLRLGKVKRQSVGRNILAIIIIITLWLRAITLCGQYSSFFVTFVS